MILQSHPAWLAWHFILVISRAPIFYQNLGRWGTLCSAPNWQTFIGLMMYSGPIVGDFLKSKISLLRCHPRVRMIIVKFENAIFTIRHPFWSLLIYKLLVVMGLSSLRILGPAEFSILTITGIYQCRSISLCVFFDLASCFLLPFSSPFSPLSSPKTPTITLFNELRVYRKQEQLLIQIPSIFLYLKLWRKKSQRTHIE